MPYARIRPSLPTYLRLRPNRPNTTQYFRILPLARDVKLYLYQSFSAKPLFRITEITDQRMGWHPMGTEQMIVLSDPYCRGTSVEIPRLGSSTTERAFAHRRATLLISGHTSIIYICIVTIDLSQGTIQRYS